MQQPTPVAPAPPGAPAIAPALPGIQDPSQVLRGFREQRSELRDQLDRLEDQRTELQDQLNAITDAAAKPGIIARIQMIDGRIIAVDKAIADADAAVARAAAIPGAVIPDPPELPRNGPPEEFFVFLMVLTIFIVVPIALAYARRIWKKGVQTVTEIPQDVYERFNRIDQAIDSVAVEVERIGENQRYVTKLVNEQRGLGAGPAERLDAPARSKAEERR
jgi:hypothetical protein